MLLKQSILKLFRQGNVCCKRRMSVINQTKNSSQIDVHLIRMKNGDPMHYYTIGEDGKKPLLVLPAAFGMAQIQLSTVLNRIDYSKYKVYTWDPVGFGHNNFKLREFNDNIYYKDAADIGEVMEIIGVDRYKLFGYCDGGIISMILAATRPKNVERLIAVHTRSVVMQSEMLNLRRRNIHENHNVLPHKTAGYGPEYIKYLVNGLSKVFENFYYKHDRNICHHMLQHIQCPTFIISGEDDRLVTSDQAFILKRGIKNSRVHIYPTGRHQCFELHTEDFMRRVHEFLAEGDVDSDKIE